MATSSRFSLEVRVYADLVCGYQGNAGSAASAELQHVCRMTAPTSSFCKIKQHLKLRGHSSWRNASAPCVVCRYRDNSVL